MSTESRPDGATYLIETRDGSEEHVVSMLEKYYGDLLTDVVRNPAGRDGVLLVTTGYELPPDAFRRYVEVDDVVQTDAAIRDRDPESVADGCGDAISDLSEGTTVSLVVNDSVTSPGDSEVRRQCEDALRTAGLIVAEDSTAKTEIRVDVVGDWVGISVN
ncbi:hypothetical protein ACFQMA_08290 [Halosimplex aquaticum]|uniref:Uncharacterized protein n=1 Tax=Halosimplex aquaticum TaxID=3026162 RepID=A0ABD5Y0S1_9EURY|nr:hypothetical protein [Halosimplex aquaticum]